MGYRAGVLGLLTAAVLAASPAAAGAAATSAWPVYDPPATSGTVTQKDVPITMSDGVVLKADVLSPDKPGRYPVLLQQTPYNKTLVDSGTFGDISAFPTHGYVVVIADVRGTGSSAGTWDSFGDREQRDGYELTRWAATQDFSNGKVGLFGASYMGLNQIQTAAQHPAGLKAIFPVVPMADGYRDIVLSGGQANTGFIPLWLGLVTAGGLVPPADAASGDPNDLAGAVTTLLDHVGGAISFQSTTTASLLTGGDLAFDGPFWTTRSPIELVDDVDVPAFVIGGEHDLFQRGEPLLYERLRQRVPAKLLIGPWTHVAAATGEGLPAEGAPETLTQMQLQFFDHYLKGVTTGLARVPAVTQYDLGTGRYAPQPHWPDPRARAVTSYLRSDQTLSADPPTAAGAGQRFVQQPLSGICTQSTSQWTAGLGSAIPCTQDNRLDGAGGATYTSAPLTADLHVDGPLLADLWVTTTARDAVVTVRVDDVAPDGTPTELTAGWLSGSFRANDAGRSRFLDGKLIQPWHPFTRESVLDVTPGVPIELAVEVFPTNATLAAGHRLRVSVGPSDFPHAVPPLPQLANSLAGVVTVLDEPGHASSLTVPVVGSTCATRTRTAACPPLPVPNLRRGD